MPAAFQMFLLMVQNKVQGLTHECCKEVLDVLMADSSSPLWDYVAQHCGESFLELLLDFAAEQTNKSAVFQLPPHGSLPTLTMWTSPDGAVQRLSVADGPIPAWMLPAWQRIQPDNAVASVAYNSTDWSSTTHFAEASNGPADASAEQSQPHCASGNLKMLSADYSTALQELEAMPKSQVGHIMQQQKTGYLLRVLSVLMHLLKDQVAIQDTVRRAYIQQSTGSRHGSMRITLQCFAPSITRAGKVITFHRMCLSCDM